MKQGQFSNEQIVAILQQADKGEKPVTEICKSKGISGSDLLRVAQKVRRDADA
jgi:putative intracellular protease/amidase